MRNIYNLCAALILALYPLAGASAQQVTEMSIEFNKTVHDFGYIDINSGPKSYAFYFKNISKQTVIIQTVISSCGCTTPEWTKEPIKPGENGKIDVTFLNDQGAYPFDKSLTVYVTGSSRPIVLRIKGVVTQKPKSVKQQYPVKIGHLGLKKNQIDYGQAYYGSISKGAVEVVNLAGSPIKVTFTDFSKGFYINANPEVIGAGARSDLIFSIDTRAAHTWGPTVFSATPVINGKKADKSIQVKATILEDFTRMSKEELDNAPLPIFSKSSYNFGEVKAGTVVKASFDYRNVGRSDMIIRQIQYSEDGLTATYKENTSPGAASGIVSTFNTKGMSGEKNLIITIITNSPTRPIINLIISGKIIK
ncbi:hypothetical protein BRDCF_p1375 [Bacteroidales bacterium CF]|nr:hypothetical protein BRDCF_p1375 [Bacteroidales bacterium CF]